MTELQLILFGDMQVRLGDVDISRSLSTKAQALLAYLVVTARQQSRSALTGLLWGDKPDEDARRSLRVEFAKMRPFLDVYLDITRQTAVFVRETPYWLDAEAFEYLLKLAHGTDVAAERAHLREAITLYRGEFLEGCMIPDSPAFEEWVLAQRERYRMNAIQALDRLIEICREQKEFATGIEYANRLLAIDPWREEAHQQLMWLLALDGQRSAALRQYEVCRDVLASELGVKPSSQTEALLRRIREQADGGRPLTNKRPLPLPDTQPASDPIPFQSPNLVPYFVGRQEQLPHLATQVAETRAPGMVCLVGMGGVGKSSLAIHLAHHLRSQFPDGVLWADASLTEPVAIAERWASAFGYDFSGLAGIEARLAALRHLLAGKEALIVLDDVMVAARVKPLLPPPGRCAVIATSRSADVAYALGADVVYVDVLSVENGRSLLAGMIGENRLRAESLAAEQIVGQLQQLPLALAIAGRYLAVRPRRSLADFARRLADETQRLTVGLGDTAVRGSFTVSWQGLDEEQKRIFALLTVFNGRRFSADALAYIANIDDYLAQDRLDNLASLSLLTGDDPRYYRQHALLAMFAREKNGDEERPFLRFIDYFRQYATAHAANYSALDPEWENLDAAIDAAHNRQRWADLLAYVTTLRAAWIARGRFDAARQAYEKATQAAEQMGETAVLAQTLLHWAQATLEQNDFAVARTLFERCLTLYHSVNDQTGIAAVLFDLAWIAMDHNNQYDEADRLLQESRRIREQLGNPADLANVIYRQSRLAYRRGQWQEADEMGRQALRIQESNGCKREMARTLRNLFWTQIEGWQAVDVAETYADRALALAREIGDVGELAMALYCRGNADRLRRNYAAALQNAEQSAALLSRMGDNLMLAHVTFLRCWILRDTGQYPEALQAAEQSLTLFQEFGDQQAIMYVWGNIGIIHYLRGAHQAARPHLERSAAEAKKRCIVKWQQIMQEFLAKVEAASG